ncbi:MAG: UbiA family prenyltransferase [Burkholderiales bacterium]|nr:UbiA family prenyltransferase [Burkholderiales bacterium]
MSSFAAGLPVSHSHSSARAGDTADADVPLYVDLDGTLSKTDALWESFASALRRRPWALPGAIAGLTRGRAALKRRLAELGRPDAAVFPLREAFADWLAEQRAAGRRIVLATAAERELAEAVAARVGLFDAVLASDGQHNLKGPGKLEAIRRDAAGRAFDYCGNGPEDVPIFAAARRAIVVGAPPGVLRRARQRAEVGRVFDAAPSPLAKLLLGLRAARPHQWLKNLLVLVPMLTAFKLDEGLALSQVLLAFLSFSLAASSGYLLNDLLDLAADRRHPRKRERAFAAGLLSVRSGFAGAALLLIASLAIAIAVGRAFTGWVVIYLLMTGAYSGFAKRIALLDVAMLAGLYTVRVLAGGAAIGVALSFWLLAFSVFLFFSLALVKRCGELVAQLARAEETGRGRGYEVSDLSVLQMLGIATSCAALLVLALYVQEPEVTQRYASPQILWVMLFGLLVWLGRLWLDTARGLMHDDPLVYALQNPASRWLVVLLLALYAVAALVSLPGLG